MKAKLLLFVLIVIVAGCKKNNDIPDPPSIIDTENYVLVSGKAIQQTPIPNDAQNRFIVTEVNDENYMLFKYLDSSNYSDGTSPTKELIGFQVHKDSTEFEFVDAAIANIAKAYYIGGFNSNANAISEGLITGKKIDNRRWELNILVKFATAEGTSKIVNVFDKEFTKY